MQIRRGVIQEPQPPLGACDIEERADDGAGDGADTADDHDEQDLIGHGGGKGVGLDAGLEHGQQGAADAGKEGADEEGLHLVLGQVDAHGFGGDLVIPDGLEGPAVGGVDEQHDKADTDGRHDEREQNGVEVGELLQQVGGVGQGAHLLPLDDGAHNFGKAQGGNGQIVTLELQHRQTDEPGEDGRHDARQNQAHDHRHTELHNAAVKVLVHAGPVSHGNGQDTVGVGADHHEARLTQGKQAREAVEQVQRYRHQRVDGALFQDGGQHRIVLEFVHIQQECNADGCQKQ